MSKFSSFLGGLFGTPVQQHAMGAIEAAVHLHGPIGPGEKSEMVRLVQTKLRYSGAEIVPDSEFGDLTRTALKRFQASHALPVTGIVDVLEAVLLDGLRAPLLPTVPAPSVLKQTPWVSDVRACTGIKEVPGSANSPIIMSWRGDFARLKRPEVTAYAATYPGDATPWCGFGLGAAMARCGIVPPFGPEAEDRFMWADSWAHTKNWPGATVLQKPMTGCVMIFTRSGGGHVTMLEKIDGDKLWCRGFNQSDMVNVSTRTLDRTFTAAVWPPGFPVVNIQPSISNAVSTGKEV